MSGLGEMLIGGGPFALAVVPVAIGSAVAIIALGVAGVMRFRIPFALWLIPGLLSVVVGAASTIWGMRAGSSAAARASYESIAAVAAQGYVSGHYAEILALLIASISFMAAAVAGCTGVARAEHPRWSAVNAAIPAACGVLGGFAILFVSAISGAAGTSVVGVAAVVIIGGASMAVVSSARSRSRKETERLAELRVGVCAAALLGLLAWTTAWRITHTTAALQDPGQFAQAAAVSWAGLAGFVVLLLAAVGATAPVASRIANLRTFGGGVVAAILTSGAVVAHIAGILSSPTLTYDAFGGSIQDEAFLAVAKLPPALDLADAPGGDALVGTCFAVDGPSGWRAGPLYESIDPQTHIDTVKPPDVALSELDSMPGCPPQQTLLDGPLSRFELPVLAISEDRLAPAVTGQEWFVDEGDLKLLLAPADLGALPPRSRARASKTVTFHWERPPKDTLAAPPPEDGEPGDWNYPAARVMLRDVLVLEGPVPMVVSEGARAWLKEGEEGAQQLRDAMQVAQHRNLVLVPRKNWTTGDLARLCLSVREVEDARCVIRPENTVRWSERTGLALPW